MGHVQRWCAGAAQHSERRSPRREVGACCGLINEQERISWMLGKFQPRDGRVLYVAAGARSLRIECERHYFYSFLVTPACRRAMVDCNCLTCAARWPSFNAFSAVSQS